MSLKAYLTCHHGITLIPRVRVAELGSLQYHFVSWRSLEPETGCYPLSARIRKHSFPSKYPPSLRRGGGNHRCVQSLRQAPWTTNPSAPLTLRGLLVEAQDLWLSSRKSTTTEGLSPASCLNRLASPGIA